MQKTKKTNQSNKQKQHRNTKCNIQKQRQIRNMDSNKQKKEDHRKNNRRNVGRGKGKKCGFPIYNI